LGGFGGGFGRGLEALGASWLVLEALIFMLVFGVVFKSALGGSWDASWLDFEGFAEDLGRVLGGFWEGVGGIFKHSGGFWAIVAFSWVIGVFLVDFYMIFAGAPYCLLTLFWLVLACCGLLWLL